ncbi:MAG: hypothetical protein ACR5K9_08175, partial [Wolbachia sp.]
YSWTKKERAIYDQAKKREDDNVSCLNQKFNEGKKEGIQIGEERGIQIGHEKGREEGIQVGEEKGREEGIQIGEEKGREAEKIEVAKNLLKAGISIDVISQTTGLSKAEIGQLQEEIAL